MTGPPGFVSVARRSMPSGWDILAALLILGFLIFLANASRNAALLALVRGTTGFCRSTRRRAWFSSPGLGVGPIRADDRCRPVYRHTRRPICMHRKKINISHVLAGQRLGIKEVDDGIWLVSFMTYDLGYIDLEQRTLQTIDNPFGAKLLPMS